jgi:DMSO reductase family type II enzyme chaperone
MAAGLPGVAHARARQPAAGAGGVSGASPLEPGRPAPGPAARGLVAPRPPAVVAARCDAYAACSELVASPHDVDVRAALAGRQPALATLPWARDLAALAGEVAAAGNARLRAEYSGLFEVGNEGPPVPIREDLQTGQLAGTREDLVRFYDFFGYRLDDRFAWAPDHLSVEFEFMHFLCYHEAAPAPDPLSYALAQLDFTERHLVRWVPTLVTATGTHAAGSLYARVVAGIDAFLRADHDWQRGTIGPAPGGA